VPEKAADGAACAFIDEEGLGLAVDVFDVVYERGVSEELGLGLEPDLSDHILDALILYHHFLVVAFDLVGVPACDQLRHVLEQPDVPPRGLSYKNLPEIEQIGDVGVIFGRSPPLVPSSVGRLQLPVAAVEGGSGGGGGVGRGLGGWDEYYRSIHEIKLNYDEVVGKQQMIMTAVIDLE